MPVGSTVGFVQLLYAAHKLQPYLDQCIAGKCGAQDVKQLESLRNEIALNTAVAVAGILGPRIAVGSRTTFSVDPAMAAGDEAAGVLSHGVYKLNPTAQVLTDLLTESGKIGGKNMNGRFMFVVNEARQIIIGSRGGQRMPHPTLLGGEDPKVLTAGIVEIRAGRVYSVDNASGHYKPGAESLDVARAAFGALPESAFAKDFQGYSAVSDSSQGASGAPVAPAVPPNSPDKKKQ